MDDLLLLSLVDVAKAIRNRDVSSLEVTRASLERIESLQPKLNCFLEVEAEEALATAAKADALLAQGEAMGPLHGVPLAHKDIFFRAGKICSGGTRLRQSHVMEHTATVLQRLAGAGALSLGRLNLSEFSIGPTGHNDHFGTCHNPWNLKCITGGSSSGPAAAVSARLIFGSLGSDTGGSVRIPAALCGLVGMKPTHGRVSRSGVLPISFSTDTPGPLTRTVRDCARLCRVIAGRDDDDAVTSTEPVEDYEASCRRNIRGIRIGTPREYSGMDVVPVVRQALVGALDIYRSCGATLRDVDLPDLMRINHLTEIVTRSEAASVHSLPLQDNRDGYSPQLLRRLSVGSSIPATWYIRALSARGALLREFHDKVFEACDLLMLPTVMIPAPTIEKSDVGASDELPKVLLQLTGLTRPISYLGLPALTIPAGFSADGLPLSFQLVGPHFSESLLFAVGHAYQQETDWHTRVPPEVIAPPPAGVRKDDVGSSGGRFPPAGRSKRA